jgi:hypothetical protein
MPFGTQRGWMRYALPRPEILSYPLETNVIDSVVLNSSGVAPDASGPFMNRRYLIAGTVLSKRPDNTYERFTNATTVAAQNSVQQVQMVGPPTGGTFRLAVNNVATGALAYNISAAALQTALQGLSSVGAGNATVTLAGNTYTVTFGGGLAGQNIPAMESDPSQLTGPGNQDAVVTVQFQGSAAEATQNVAGILFDTTEFADGTELSDEPVAMLRRNCSFKQSAIVDWATLSTQIIAGLPTCEFI